MRVNEIFYSIQGEGTLAGVPTIFVRLNGCNLTCRWCDTTYAQDLFGGVEKPPERVAFEVAQIANCRWVCITGGEPLFQEKELRTLVGALSQRGYRIEIETNGSLPVPSWWREVECWCPDVKCPSSGVQDRNSDGWLSLREQDQVKFVVGTEEDLRYTKLFLEKHKDCKSTILISPVINLIRVGGKEDYLASSVWFQRCVEFVKENQLRLSLQVHKFIWPPNQRGV